MKEIRCETCGLLYHPPDSDHLFETSETEEVQILVTVTREEYDQIKAHDYSRGGKPLVGIIEFCDSVDEKPKESFLGHTTDFRGGK